MSNEMGRTIIRRVKVESKTGLAASTPVNIDFRSVQKTHARMKGYALGIIIMVTFAVQESVATADIPAEKLWNILGDVSMSCTTHEWFNSFPARGLTLLNAMSGVIRPSNGDTFALAGIASSGTSAKAASHTYLIDLAKGYYREGQDNAWRDGLYPLALLGDKLNLSFNTGAGTPSEFGGAWNLSGTISVDVFMDILYTDEAILPTPWKIRHFNTTDQEAVFPTEFQKLEMVLVTDDGFGSFTLPTVEVTASLDDQVFVERCTGAQINKLTSLHREDNITGIYPSNVLCLALPTDHKTRFTQPAGSELTVRNAAVTHATAAKYISQGWVELSPASLKQAAMAVGIKELPNGDQLSVGGVKATGRRKSRSEMLGISMAVK